MRNIAKRFLTVALAGMMLFGSTMTTFAVESEMLSEQIKNEDGTLKVKLDNDNLNASTGNITIIKNSNTDAVTLYQIATFNFDKNKMEWNRQINDWCLASNNVTYGGKSYNFSKYQNYPEQSGVQSPKSGPELLGAASTEVQKAFFTILLRGNESAQGKIDTADLPVAQSSDGTTKVIEGVSVSSNAPKDLVTITTDNYNQTEVTDLLGGTPTQITGFIDPSTVTFYKEGVSVPNGDGIINESFANAQEPKWPKSYKYTLNGVEYSEGQVLQKADGGSFSFEKMPIGMYIADGSYDNGSRQLYAPLTIALTPEKDGATGNWYLSDVITNQKAAELYMEKFINGKKSDIVKIGEVVDFEIEFQIPKYGERQVGDNVKEYTLTFDDNMDDAFAVIPTSVKVDIVNVDPGTGNKTYTQFPEACYDSLIANPALENPTTDEGFIVQGCSPEHLSAYRIYRNHFKYYLSTLEQSKISNNTFLDNNNATCNVEEDEWGKYVWYYGYYYYRDGAYHMLKNDTQNAEYVTYYGQSSKIKVPATPSSKILAGNEVRALYSNETKDTIGHSWYDYLPSKVDEYNHTIFNVTFNYREMLNQKASLNNLDNLKLRITYQAVVTDKIEPGSENNTNEAVMTYEIDANGKVLGTIKDIVRAYTYELNLIKEDGDTVNEQTPTPLAGAKFSLFRETNTYDTTTDHDFIENYDHEWYYSFDYPEKKPIDPSAGTKDPNYYKTYGADMNYTAEAYATMAAMDMDAYITELKTQDTIRLGEDGKLVKDPDTGNVQKKQEGIDFYKYEDGSTVRIFELYEYDYTVSGANVHFKGEFTSEADLAGKKTNGLDVGHYILVETYTPSPYNLLAEDIYFEVNALDPEDAKENHQGSFAPFEKAKPADASAEQVLTGVYDMTVLNYKGLQLPSTGGIGTTIFTIIGIVIMLAAIVLVVKGKRKAIAGTLAVFVIATSVLSLAALTAHAETAVNLNNNKYGSTVTGDGTAVFTANLKNEGDTIQVYKVAKMTWNATDQTYVGPVWQDGFVTAIKNEEAFNSYDFDKVKDPVALAEQDMSLQVEFISKMYDWMSTKGAGFGYETTTNMVLDQKTKLSYTDTAATYGIYLVKATGSGGKEYQPILANVLPTQEGPFGNWFMKSPIEADLKYSDVKISKTINGKPSDTVMRGEVVEFVLDAEVPDYPPEPVLDPISGEPLMDDNGDPLVTYEHYYFTIIDNMSEAFSLVRDEKGMPKDLKIEYRVYQDSTKTWEWIDVPEDQMSVLFNEEAASEKGPGVISYTSNGTADKLYLQYVYNQATDNYSQITYYYNEQTGKLVQIYKADATEINAPAEINATAIISEYNKITGKSVTSFKRDGSTLWEQILAVGFQYEDIMGVGDLDTNPSNIRITYYGEVTDESNIGTDDNFNEVIIKFVKDKSGEVDEKKDIVYAWTYEAVIKKVDGDSGNPLENAEFKVYKENYIYASATAGISETKTTDYSKYSWVASVGTDSLKGTKEGVSVDKAGDGVTAPAGLETLDVASTTLEGMYVRVVEAESSTSNPCDLCGSQSTHNHLVVYNLYDNYDGITPNKTIKSTKDANGVKISGLEPGSYILIETNAPDGYNKLNEAIRFEIQEINVAVAKKLNKDQAESLRGFFSDEKEEVSGWESLTTAQKNEKIAELEQNGFYQDTDGVFRKAYPAGSYVIEVKNYAGLTLPSTGGVGTMLFTIIGIVIMVSAFVFIIVKRRKAY